MRAGLIQLCSSDDPVENLSTTIDLVKKAHADGADFVLTPEVTNCVSLQRARQIEVLQHENEDRTLRALRSLAHDLQVWLLIGSLALKTDDADGRFANRSFLISPTGTIQARYDKIHMFDVALSETEKYEESSGYRPGQKAVLTQVGQITLGMTICYDLRFPALYHGLAQRGATVLSVPSAFSCETGQAHWECLLRARAIETGSYVLAPAQSGRHKAVNGTSRKTYGHTMVIDPWGSVIAQAQSDYDVVHLDLDLAKVAQSRKSIPVLSHQKYFAGPQ